jgi:ATP/maltotriose-dependent transcriptional regulator MalT
VLAALAYERARASESAAEAAAHIAGVLESNRLVREQETDVAGALYLLLIGLLSTDELDVADACLEGMLAHARDRASLPAQAFVIVHRGWFQLRRGAVARAEEDARTALDLLTTHEIQLGTQFALALLIRVLIETGQVDDADKALRDSGVGDEIPPGMATNALLESRGLLRAAQGRATDALADLSAFGRNDELFGGANALGSRWRSHAALAGDPGEGRELALEDLDRARRWGAASGIGVALRATALTGDPADAIAGLRDAAGTLAKSPDRLEHARALTDLGAALRRSNQRADARAPLGDAIDLADACGARAVAERARTELRAAGGQPRPAGGGFDDLTVSERRVAELAADGLSNPEIAQTLFVTRKTVETHLGRVYRKLGITGRAQLSQELGARRSGT